MRPKPRPRIAAKSGKSIDETNDQSEIEELRKRIVHLEKAQKTTNEKICEAILHLTPIIKDHVRIMESGLQYIDALASQHDEETLDKTFKIQKQFEGLVGKDDKEE